MRFLHQSFVPAFAVGIGVFIGACARYEDDKPSAEAAMRPTAKASCQQRCPNKPAKVVTRVVRPSIDTGLLVPSEAPRCAVNGVDPPSPGSDEPGASADPNLVEIARLQLERDCFKEAEEEARRRLSRLQSAISSGT